MKQTLGKVLIDNSKSDSRFFVFLCYFFNHIFLSQRLLSIFLNTAFYFTKITEDKMFFQTQSKSAEFAGIIVHQREFCGILGRVSSSNRLVDSVQAAIPRGALRGGVCVLCGVLEKCIRVHPRSPGGAWRGPRPLRACLDIARE